MNQHQADHYYHWTCDRFWELSRQFVNAQVSAPTMDRERAIARKMDQNEADCIGFRIRTWRAAMRAIGYTYEADCHCIGCTFARYERGGFKIDAGALNGTGLDPCGISYGAVDREGNSLHPIFSTDEMQLDEDDNEIDTTCGTCGGTIKEGFRS